MCQKCRWFFCFWFVVALLLTALPACRDDVPDGVVSVVEETAVSPTPAQVITSTPTPTTTLTVVETAVATITQLPLATKTVTAQPTATSIPAAQFATPVLPSMIAEAGASAELYQLQEWSDTEAAALVSLMNNYADRIRADYELISYYGDRGRQLVLESGNEFILRYPESQYRKDVEWLMVDASTYFPSRELNELLANLIETDLNAGLTTLETLNVYLQSHGLKISNKHCQSCELLPTSIPNLLGDGRDIPLFLIERQSDRIEGGVLIAIWQNANGEFVVTPIISQWAAVSRFSGSIETFEARHITGNPQPELFVKLWGHSGSMIGVSLYMFRWDGERFVHLEGTPFSYAGGVFGDEWTFIDDDNPSRLQAFSKFTKTTLIYEWVDDSYQTVEVISEDNPPDPTDSLRASDWIQKKIGQENYSEVIAYLEDALQKPSSDYNPFGPQYHRSMRFILGMNYVYLEDEEMATAVFESLRDEPTPPELIGFSEAVGAFLEQYNGVGTAYEACRAAYEVMLETELNLSGISELMPLCAFTKLFLKKLNNFDRNGDIFDFVSADKIIHSQQHDLNGDGQLDWLLALTHPTLFTYADVEVWALLQTNAGIDVVKLTTLRPYPENFEEISVHFHNLPLFDTPLVVILSNNVFRMHRLTQSEDGWKAKLLIGDGITIDYSLQMVAGNLQLDSFIDASTSSSGIDRISYHLDVESEKFVEISRHAPNSLGIPFEDALDTAESLIFENGDYGSAIPILTTIVAEFDPTTEFAWRFSLPKALYLLGLAHEMQGNKTEAVAAYWQLWHEHPTDPYALMASAKLEPVP